MDPTHPNIDSLQNPVYDWNEFYSDIEEPIPPNAPKAIGKILNLRIFFDSDHIGDQLI